MQLGVWFGITVLDPEWFNSQSQQIGSKLDKYPTSVLAKFS